MEEATVENILHYSTRTWRATPDTPPHQPRCVGTLRLLWQLFAHNSVAKVRVVSAPAPVRFTLRARALPVPVTESRS